MKKQFIFLYLLFILFSCENFVVKNESLITYEFEDAENVPDTTKKETVEIIKNRIQKFTRYVDVSLNSKDEILVKIKTTFSVDRLNAVVLNQGKLDFWLCYKQDELWPFISDANKAGSNNTLKDPLNAMFQGLSSDGIFNIYKTDVDKFNTYFNQPEIKLLFAKQYKDLKFLFGRPDGDFISVYAIKSNEKGRALITENNIIDIRQDYDQINRPAISIDMDKYGAYNWAKLTNDAYKTNAKIAITINDIVYSAPLVSGGSISGGKSQISGNFTLQEAQNLSFILGAQKSIPKLKFISVSELEN